MKPKSASTIVVLSVLLTLIVTVQGAAPAQAVGLYGHTWFVERAIQRLVAYGGYSELVDILNRYPEIVNYGAIFPDITYGGIDGDWAEVIHDSPYPDVRKNYEKYLQYTVDKGINKYDNDAQTGYYKAFLEDPAYNAKIPAFRTALMGQVLSHFKNRNGSVDNQKMIAFLFGLIAHQEADNAWHWNVPNWVGFEEYAKTHGMNSCGFLISQLNDAEVCFDVVLRNYDTLFNANVWDTGYLSTIKPVVYAASDAVGFGRPQCKGRAWDGLFWICSSSSADPYVDGQSQISYFVDAQKTNLFYDAGWKNLMQTYVPGGIENGSAFVAGAWMQTWDRLSITATYYVKATASGLGNCTSWNNACTLQDALVSAVNGEIWVATGVYTPTVNPANRNASFHLQSGVAVYGGFAGTENARSQRNPATNLTILSGDIDNNDIKDTNGIITNTANITGTNSYHVVTSVSGSGTLDGFIVTGGRANGTGGGADGTTCDPYGYYFNLIDLSYMNACGGGMLNYGVGPTVTNVTFSGNAARNKGGGMLNYYSSSTVTNVTFSGNAATSGGGVHNYGFFPTFTTSTFSGNTATGNGGAVDNHATSATFTNVTVAGNSANYGGGISNIGGGTPKIRNTILWANNAPNGKQIYNNNSTPTVSDSVIQGGYPYSGGERNITSNPKLLSLANNGGSTQTIEIQQGSSAINKGNLAYCISGQDQRGESYDGMCDIGAYEYKGPFSNVIYAKESGVDYGICYDWDHACTLQYALYRGVVGDEIWVAKGVYPPSTVSDDRTATFQLKSGVAVYGGFPNTGNPGWADRNPSLYPTVLSGDIDNNDVKDANGVITNTANITGTNSYHVVTGANTSALNGFIITGGYANNGTVTDCQNNDGVCGGGMLNNGVSVIVEDVTFSGNYAERGAGGMYNKNVSASTFSNVTFQGNKAKEYGGGVSNYQSNATFTSVTFRNNTAGGNGGGVDNCGFTGTFNGATFENNSAQNGGGMLNICSSTPEVTGATFRNNTATNKGGGIANDHSSPTLTDVTFHGNTVTNGNGGGIQNFVSGPSLTNVAFISNVATNGNGGGIHNSSEVLCFPYGAGSDCYIYFGDPSLTNVTFISNTAQLGGGIDNDISSPTLTNVTFRGNTATNGSGGGGIHNKGQYSCMHWFASVCTAYETYGSNSNVRNSILWGNSGGEIANDSYSTPTVSNSVVQGGYGGTGNLNVNPSLGTFGTYGGNGQQIIPLLPNSPSIEATGSNCPSTDQRELPRSSPCDIGAFESQGFTLNKSRGDNQSTLINTPFTSLLSITVASNYGEPVNGGQVILTAPTTGATITGTTPITLTIAGGIVSRTVAANNVTGSYTVTVRTRGAANAYFNLANKLGTITMLNSSSPNPSTIGQTVTFTATVGASGASKPKASTSRPLACAFSGAIQFQDGSTNLGSPQSLDASCQATYTTSALAIGSHPITAIYNGDGTYLTSTSNLVNQVVNSIKLNLPLIFK